MSVNEIVKKLRISREMTQIDLAEKLNCNRQKIADWERGKATPSASDLILLSKIFEVSTDYLLGLTAAPTTDKDVRYICDYTGLSEEAVEALANFKSYLIKYCSYKKVDIKTGIDEVDELSKKLFEIDYQKRFYDVLSKFILEFDCFEPFIRYTFEYVKNQYTRYVFEEYFSKNSKVIQNLEKTTPEYIQSRMEIIDTLDSFKKESDYALFRLQEAAKDFAKAYYNDFIKGGD